MSWGTTPLATPHAGRRASQRGVTLIEMLVVVIIIALVISISTPSVTAGIDAVRLATASSSVAAFLNSASNHADRLQRPVEVVVSAKGLQSVSTDAGSQHDLVLPDGIKLQPVSDQLVDDPEAVTRLLFMPGGAVPGIGLQLSNQHGGRRIVRLDPMTGAPHVENLKPQ